MVEGIIRSQKDLLEKTNQIYQLELKIQELMVHFDEALSEESNLMESLQATCIKATDLRLKCKQVESSLYKDLSSAKGYKSTASQLTELFMILKKLGNAEPSLTLSFRKFASLTVQDIKPRKMTGWGRLLDANSLLIAAQNIYKYNNECVSYEFN